MKLNLFAIVALLFTINLVTVYGYVNCKSLNDPVQKCICQVRENTSIKLTGCKSNNATVKKRNDEIMRIAKTAVEEICKAQVKSKDRNGKDCIKAFDLNQFWCRDYETCSKSCTDSITTYLDHHYSKFEEQSFFITTNSNYILFTYYIIYIRHSISHSINNKKTKDATLVVKPRSEMQHPLF